MKIQLDTINKTITIEEDVNLHDFYEQINSLLPSGLWREFTLKVTEITKWKDPIPWTPSNPYPTIDPYTPIGVPNTTPYNPPQIWYTTTSNGTELNPGVYNFKM
jgi:hypothetical protein